MSEKQKELIWCGSFWEGAKLRQYVRAFISDGVIEVEQISEKECKNTPVGQNTKLYKRIANKGYNPKIDNVSHQTEMISKILLECNGQTMKQFDEMVAEKAMLLSAGRKHKLIEGKRWNDLRQRFGGVVIGLEKNVDVYQTGFSVRVLLRTGLTMDEKRAFVRENKKELVKWVMEEVVELNDFKNYVGDISFYRPAEVIIMKIAELEMKFEIKKEVAV